MIYSPKRSYSGGGWRGREREREGAGALTQIGERSRHKFHYSFQRAQASQNPGLSYGAPMIRTIAYWGIYGRAVSVIVLEDSKTPLGRKRIC